MGRERARDRKATWSCAMQIAVGLAATTPWGAQAQQAAAPADSVARQLPSDGSEASKEQELAKQLANPVASLISVPFQFNYDQKLNTLDTGKRVTLNIQPVIPISLGPDWNLISRTILPLSWSENAVVAQRDFWTATRSRASSCRPPSLGAGSSGASGRQDFCRPAAATSTPFTNGVSGQPPSR